MERKQNFHISKKTISIFSGIVLVIIGVLAFFNLPTHGDVSHVSINYGSSKIYSKKEIEAAINAVKKEFSSKYQGCDLKKLWYDEAFSEPQMAGWAEQYNADEAIILLSDYLVSKNGGDGSMEPNETYTDWSWILVRNKNGSWRVATCGWG